MIDENYSKFASPINPAFSLEQQEGNEHFIEDDIPKRSK